MLYFATPSGPAVVAAIRRRQIGMIVTPQQGNALPDGVDWCGDNGCGPVKGGAPGAGYPGDAAYLAGLARHTHAAGWCWFVTAPDVLYDAAATVARSAPLLPKIRALGYPAALVAQDGAENITLPWADFDVLFIGGGTWKLSPAAAALAQEALARGKRVHMGRVSSLKRIRYADHIGCASADGTYLRYAPDKLLPNVLLWRRDLLEQRPLFDQGDLGDAS